MNGLFAGGFWTRHALLGEIRTLKRNLGRDSYVPQIAGRGPELDAQEPPSVQMSPENAIPIRMPREGLRSRPYTRPNASNAVATPSSHTGSVT